MTAKLERDKARLVEVCAAVNANRSDGEVLFRERDELLRELKAEGVPTPELVVLSSMTPRALKWVLSGGQQTRAAKAAAKKKAVKKRLPKKRASKKKAAAKKRAPRSA